MARFSRAARQGDSIRGRCDIRLHTRSHHCFHSNSGTCNGISNVFINGRAAQKVGDAVVFSGCQHGGIGKIAEGSESVYINGHAAARVKDSARCQNGMCGQTQIIVDGADNVFIG